MTAVVKEGFLGTSEYGGVTFDVYYTEITEYVYFRLDFRGKYENVMLKYKKDSLEKILEEQKQKDDMLRNAQAKAYFLYMAHKQQSSMIH